MKSLTINDILRAFYYEIILILGISNKYRYEHFLSKSDFYYNLEKLKVGLQLPAKCQKTQTKNWVLFYKYYNEKLLEFLK